ncbi:arylamine N-acetyltransferase family protein [Pseudalkalibacillus hwajinpoensis]|uniref:arylamine N-acetyltransferase family protein n=1 Tax=Guptibacillus hwajinpoensis TaxID=208199 RepID=UPI001CD3B662|nr:arylamine N-acetyltransferase [Pseudalkalibacillus hwajinpoensis]MCA0993537.1 arylamine N-acetyltransferase [Pseudalkalibacillus hwajinpoensis]
MNVEKYLKRISTKQMQVNFHSLQLLQRNHMHKIPFENLDISRKRWIDLDIESIYAKIIENKRGGLCFELNPLFNWLLTQIGFTTVMVTGTVAIDEKNWGKENTHLTNLVELEGTTYLTDVGFGNSSQTPIPLSGEIVDDGFHRYKIVHRSNDMYDLQQAVSNDTWKTQIRFSTAPRTLAEYEPLSSFIQTHPNSPFTNHTIVTIATNNGRITLTDDSLVITQHHYKNVFNVNDDEWNYLYNSYF